MRFQHAGDRAGKGKRRAVQGVHEARLSSAAGPVADPPAARLEIDEGAARGDLEPLADAGCPRLDVIRLRAGEAGVARRQQLDSIGEAKGLHDRLGVGQQSLQRSEERRVGKEGRTTREASRGENRKRKKKRSWKR